MGFWKKDLRCNEGVHGEADRVLFDVILRKIEGSNRHPEVDVEVRLPDKNYSTHLTGYDSPLEILDGLDVIVIGKIWEKARLVFNTRYLGWGKLI